VVRADGSVAMGRRQLDLLRGERVPMRGERVNLRHARWEGMEFTPTDTGGAPD